MCTFINTGAGCTHFTYAVPSGCSGTACTYALEAYYVPDNDTVQFVLTLAAENSARGLWAAVGINSQQLVVFYVQWLSCWCFQQCMICSSCEEWSHVFCGGFIRVDWQRHQTLHELYFVSWRVDHVAGCRTSRYYEREPGVYIERLTLPGKLYDLFCIVSLCVFPGIQHF